MSSENASQGRRTMMESVAWTWMDATGAMWLTADRDDVYQSAALVGAVPEPLVRLCDAEARIRELEEKAEDADQLRRLFDQQWKRAREAGELWRQAHPGNDSVSPDLGELVKWLMDRATDAEALLKEVGKHLVALLDDLEMRAVTLKNGTKQVAVSDGVYHRARAISDKIGVKDE